MKTLMNIYERQFVLYPPSNPTKILEAAFVTTLSSSYASLFSNAS